MIPFADSSLERVFGGYPDLVRGEMYGLRDLIFGTAGRLGVIRSLCWDGLGG